MLTPAKQYLQEGIFVICDDVTPTRLTSEDIWLKLRDPNVLLHTITPDPAMMEMKWKQLRERCIDVIYAMPVSIDANFTPLPQSTNGWGILPPTTKRMPKKGGS